MAILYVASEEAELKPFANLLTGLRKLKWPIDYAWEGIWEGRRVMLAANGAGPRLAFQAVEIAIRAVTAAELSSSRLEGIVSTGFCGALDPQLKPFQIVAADQVLDLATNEVFDCARVTSEGEVAIGKIVSQDRIANNSAEKQALRVHSAIAVDMEAAGVAARTKRAGLPFYCIKVVSDCANESFGFDLNKMRTSEGRLARGKIGYYTVTHPNIIPELFRLRGRAEGAAKALGDFLVSCRISSESNVTPAE